MTLHTFPTVDQGTEEWHTLRRGLITASVVGQLLTPTLKVADNPQSRSIVAQLVAERISGWTDPTFTNGDMMRGVLHEPVARETYAQHNGVTVEQIGFMVRDDWGFKIGCSPDGLIGDDGGLEIKCPRAKTHVQTIVANEVPAHYMAQVQTCLLVSGREWWDFVSFCSGLPLWTKRVHPDVKWHTEIVSAVANFEVAAERLGAEYLGRSALLPPTERIADDVELVI